jgi:hypothetical protein
MRRASVALSALVFSTVMIGVAAPAIHAYAQSSKDREDDERRKAQDEHDKEKKKKDKEWNLSNAPLPDVKNAGPCPYVKVLYDASRYVELKDGKESAEAAGFTGEMQNITAQCRYKADEPITVKLAVNFELGRGPAAVGQLKDYHYWVAVTARNQFVLAKQEFTLPVEFAPGQDRMSVTQNVQQITIPRASERVNGSNFEVLVGFDVTPQMAEFNRLGKRFKVNAGAGSQLASAGTK